VWHPIAYYDGTDIGRPVIVDNSTGVPQYEYIEVDGYHPPSNKSKRAATSHWYRLWPDGIVYYELHSSLSGKNRTLLFGLASCVTILRSTEGNSFGCYETLGG